MTFQARRCRECGVGKITLLKKLGRVTPYKTFSALAVPADVETPTCDHCGAEWHTEETAARLDAALEAVYRGELGRRAKEALVALTEVATQGRLEQLLGLSQGYVSKLLSEERVPSAELVAHLALLAADPKTRLKELEDFWAHPAAPQ
jgi:NMD protein affecting ribosome stability and mRNA decay